jgi:hypothetical protein
LYSINLRLPNHRIKHVACQILDAHVVELNILCFQQNPQRSSSQVTSVQPQNKAEKAKEQRVK